MDVQKDYFVVAELDGLIHVQGYTESKPAMTIKIDDMESQCGIRSISSRLKEVKKVAFDHTYENHYFAILTSEVCCVYDLDSPGTMINFLLTQHCSSIRSKSNSPIRFQSFAFCGNGQMLVLTGKDIYKWDYLSCRIPRSKLASLYHHSQCSTYRRIEYGLKGNLVGSGAFWF